MVLITIGLSVLLALSLGTNWMFGRKIDRLRDQLNRKTVEAANLCARRPQVPNYRVAGTSVPYPRNAPPTFARKEAPNFPVLPRSSDDTRE